MTRREMLLMAYAPLVHPSFVYRDYPRCLPDYLSQLAERSRETRLRSMAELTNPPSVRKRQAWVRHTLLEIIGGLPERTALNARETGRLKRNGYSLSKVIYESRPNFHVSANLYIPDGTGPFPGVLFQLGHSADGKAYDPYQRACQGLVKLGFVVLAFDPIGQGERVYYPDSSGVRSRLEDVDAEHTVPGRQMLLVGSTCTQIQVWDAIRSLDYLAAHPLVDARRLASVGQSGGATISMLLAAVDDRLAVVAEFSGNTENFACRNFLPPGSTDDAEQNFVNAAPRGFDRWDLFYPFAPKPLLISISDKDSFGTYSPNYVSDSAEEFERLAGVYATLKADEMLRWADTPLPHGLSYDSRLELYNWLRLHLKRETHPISDEPSADPEAESDTRVSRSGNLVRSLGGETPFTLTRKLCDSLTNRRQEVSIAELLQLEHSQRRPAKVLKRVPSANGISLEAVDVPADASVSLPVWVFRGKKNASGLKLVLLLDDRGRNATWHEGSFCHLLAAEGIVVCAADVRGIGDLMPQFSAGAAGYARFHQEMENYGWGSLILGRSIVGQRVTDILALTSGLRQMADVREVVVVASGEMTVPAIFAAALEKSICALYLLRGVCSFESIVRSENYRHPLVNFVPGILRVTDLPELCAELAPRPIMLATPLEGDGEPQHMETTRQCYRMALARGHLSINDTKTWNAQEVSGFVRGGTGG